MKLLLLLTSLFIAITTTFAQSSPCSSGFEQCTPVGASRREVPVIGPDLARFYLELVYTIRADTSKAANHAPAIRQTDFGDSLCCAAESTCNMIRSFRIAFCWDHFTTSYFLPDGSYGSASNGSYYTPQGDTANLITGEYRMHDGTLGNIYNESPADKPESSDLPLPTPFTSSGVGAAIPASQLGAQLSSSTSPTTVRATSTSSTETVPSTSESSSPSSPTSITSTAASASTPSSSTSSSSTSGETLSTTSLTSSMPSSTPPYPSDSASDTAGSGTVGSTGAASATGVNASSPIWPPITNLAAATVVYCMAAKVLIWLVAALVV